MTIWHKSLREVPSDRSSKRPFGPQCPARRRRVWASLTLASLVVVPAGIVALPTTARAVTIELRDVASDRVERQRKFAEGSLPLPNTPDLSRFDERLAAFGVKQGAPVLIRIFKAQSELELWLRKGDRFELFAVYPVCHWSGTLGPKLREGDKQTPEGFYTVTRRQLHRIGRHPRSLNLGFPNAFDKSQARSGSYILVHGACSSVGCFAMTNAVIEEIYNLTEAAIQQGQEHVPVHVFPFRMTAENLAKHTDSPWSEFWLNLKDGHDAFERTRRAPRVNVCNGRYEFAEATAPGEGADGTPLAVCGATAAAIETLEPYYQDASLQPLLWQQVLATLSPSQRRSLEVPRGRGNEQRPRLVGAGATAETLARISTPRCSLRRASCRRHVALAEVRSSARIKTASSRRVHR